MLYDRFHFSDHDDNSSRSCYNRLWLTELIQGAKHLASSANKNKVEYDTRQGRLLMKTSIFKNFEKSFNVIWEWHKKSRNKGMRFLNAGFYFQDWL